MSCPLLLCATAAPVLAELQSPSGDPSAARINPRDKFVFLKKNLAYFFLFYFMESRFNNEIIIKILGGWKSQDNFQ